MTQLRSIIKGTGGVSDVDRDAAIAERDQLRAAGIPQRKQLQQWRSQMAAIQAGGTGAGAGGPGAAAARGGGFDDCCRRMIAAINRVNATLKSGINVKGVVKTNVQNAVKTVGGPQAAAAGGKVAGSRRAAPAAPAAAPVTPPNPGGQRLTPAQRAGFQASTAAARALRQQKLDTRNQLDAIKLTELQTRVVTRQNQVTQKNASIQQAAARAAQFLAAAEKKVGSEAMREVRELERLVKTGADSVAVAKQQAKAYNAVDASLRNQGVDAHGRGAIQGSVLGGAMGRDLKTGELNDIRKSAAAVNGFDTVDKTMADGVQPGGIFGEHSLFTQAMFGNHGFWSRMMASTGTFIVRNFAAGFVFGMTAALQEIIAQAIETESTWIRVSAALEATGKAAGSLRTDLQAISTDYGTALNDVYTVAAGLTGLFDNADDLAAGTRVVAQLEAISMGALNASEAMGTLASITGAYERDLGSGVQASQKVADVLTSVQNNLGVNVETSAEGVGRMAGMAQEMQISFEQTAVFVGQIAKLTNQTGAAAGEQFSRILGAMQTGRGRGALIQELGDKGIGEQLARGEYGKALETLISNWDGLTDAQKQNISTSVAGLRQAAAFAALVGNSAKTMHALSAATYSQGDAAERMARITDTLQVQMRKLSSNLQNLASNLVRSGVLNFVGLLLKGLNGVLGGLNEFLSVINTFADNNPIAGFFRTAALSVLGFVAALALLRGGMRGLRATMGAMPRPVQEGLNAARGAGRTTLTGAARTAAPRFSEYGSTDRLARQTRFGGVNQGMLGTRTMGFALDRSLARPLQATGNMLTTWGRSLSASERKIGTEMVARGRLAQFMGRGVQGTGMAIGGVAGVGRNLFQGNYTTGQGLLGRAEFNRLRAQQVASGPGWGRSTRADATRALQISGYQKLAAAQERAGRVAGRLGQTMGRFRLAGAGADIAMMGLLGAITLFVQGMRDQSEAAKAAEASFDSTYRPRLPGQTGDPAQDVGQMTGYMEDEVWKNVKARESFGSTMSTGWQGLRGLISGHSLDETFGTEDGGDRQFGLERTQGIVDKYKKKLEDAGKSQGAIDEIAKEYSGEMAKFAAEMEQDESVSGVQFAAGLSSIEKGNQAFAGMVTNYSELAKGVLDGISLAQDQLQAIDQFVQVAQMLDGKGTLRGMDLGPMLAGLIEDMKLPEGSDLKNQLEQISRGGLNSVETLKQTKDVMYEAFKSSEQEWEIMRAMPGMAEQAAAYYRETVLPRLQAYQQSDEALASAAADRANMLSELASNSGQYDQAIDALAEQARGMLSKYKKKRRDLGIDYQGEYDRAKDRFKEQMATWEVANKKFEEQKGLYEDYLAWRSSEMARWGMKEGADWNAYEETNLPSQFYPLLTTDPKGNKGVTQPVAPQKPMLVAPKLDMNSEEEAKAKEAAEQNKAAMFPVFQKMAEMALKKIKRSIIAEMAATANPAIKAALAAELAGIDQDFYAALGEGKTPKGSGLPKGLVKQFPDLFVTQDQKDESVNAKKEADLADRAAQNAEAAAARETALARVPPGDALAVARQQLTNARQAQADAEYLGTSSQEYQSATQQVIQAQYAITQAQGAITQANANLSAAYANARGDAVAAAQAGAAAARAALATAKQMSGGARTAEVINAEAALVGANAAIGDANLALIQSRTQVSIALAEAAGHTVKAARLQIKNAQQALAHALKQSGGENTAEANQARAQVISARAAARDAELQDKLDTIDFNLQMGRITQSSAIQAMRQILKTSDLTKQQRRSLLLKIKGMKDELSSSPWNFGDIKLPTPYQMRRYVEEHRKGLRKQAEAVRDAQLEAGPGKGREYGGPFTSGNQTTHNQSTTNEYVFQFDGSDLGAVRKVVEEVVGKAGRVRTTAARRR